jgi:hypothetical protein
MEISTSAPNWGFDKFMFSLKIWNVSIELPQHQDQDKH